MGRTDKKFVRLKMQTSKSVASLVLLTRRSNSHVDFFIRELSRFDWHLPDVTINLKVIQGFQVLGVESNRRRHPTCFREYHRDFQERVFRDDVATLAASGWFNPDGTAYLVM